MSEGGRRIMSMASDLARDLISVGREGVALLRAAVSAWLADRAPSMGAAIAYYTVFSLGPALILIIAVASLVFGKRAAEGALFNEIATLVGNESAGAAQAMLRSAAGTRSGVIASLVGLGALLFAKAFGDWRRARRRDDAASAA